MTEFPGDRAAGRSIGCGGAGSSGPVDQAARRAGQARGSVGLGGVVPGRLPAPAVSASAGGGVRRGSRRDHGGVSAYPAEVTAQMVANFDAGGAAINVLAEAAGATVRVVDIAVDVDEPLAVDRRAQGPPRQRQHRRRGRAVRDEVDGRDRCRQADRRRRGRLRRGSADRRRHGHRKHHAGNNFDRRADRLRAGRRGRPRHRRRRRGLGTQDRRDQGRALPRPRQRADPIALLRICGGADLAAMAGFCAQAAVRRTPVLLDGVVVTAAALVADRTRARRAAVVAGRSPVHRARPRRRPAAARARTDRRHADAARRGHRRRGRAAHRAGRGGGAGVDGHVRRSAEQLTLRDPSVSAALSRSAPCLPVPRDRGRLRPRCADRLSAGRRGARSAWRGRGAVGGVVGVRSCEPARAACSRWPCCWSPPADCTSTGCPTPPTASAATARRSGRWR